MTFVPTEKENKAIAELHTQANFSKSLAFACVRARGNCEYCENDLLKDSTGYWAINLDHLLPKTIFPEFIHDSNNHVFSCSLCNSIKSGFSPLQQCEDGMQKLKNDRHGLIERVIQELNKRRAKHDGYLNHAKNILGGLSERNPF